MPPAAIQGNLLLSLADRFLALGVSLLLALFWGMPGQGKAIAEISTLAQPLELGKPIEKQLSVGETHTYQMTVQAGQYLHAVVEQKNIDVVVTIFGPDGKQLAKIDSPMGAKGQEPVSLIAETSGIYRLQIQAFKEEAMPGKYEVKIEEIRGEIAGDRTRIAGERAFASEQQAIDPVTQEYLQQARAKYAQAQKLDKTGEDIQALDDYQQALSLWQAVGARYWQARTLVNIAKIYEDLGEKLKALDSYNQSLPLSRGVGDRSLEAVILNNIGAIHTALGEKQKAFDYYNQSLVLSRGEGYRAGEPLTLSKIEELLQEASTLSNIGAVYNSLGEKQKALDYYNQSLYLSRQFLADPKGEAITLNNIGAVYNSLGEKQKALDTYNQSLSLSRQVGDRYGEAVTLNNIGRVYDDLDDKLKALEYYNRALPLMREVGNQGGEASTLNNMGYAYSALGEKQKALDRYNQSLPLSRAVGDRATEASTLNNIGNVYNALGDKPKALDYYNQSLVLARAVGDKTGEASTLNNIGHVYDALGDKQKALEYCNLALPLSRAIGDRAMEALTLYNLAYLEGERGNFSEAITQMETAIEIIEDLRVKIASSELRTSYFASKQDYYEFYIDLLMQLHKTNPQKGYDAKALQASERARARSLLEILAEANADIRQGADPTLIESERKLQLQLDAIEKRRLELLSGDRSADSQMDELEKERFSLLSQYQEVQTLLRQSSPRYAALTQPQPLTLSEIQQQILDENTLLLQYSLGDDRSYLWAVTKSNITSYELPPRIEIEAAARNFRRALIAPNLRNTPTLVTKAADELSQIILKPVAEQLGNKRLAIVADGALQYIPFNALSKPQIHQAKMTILADDNITSKQINLQRKLPRLRSNSAEFLPLIVEHEIVTLPSASTLAILRRDTSERKPAPRTLAVLADPIFNTDDDRLKEKTTSELNSNNLPLEAQQIQRAASDAGIYWTRLPFTRTEAEAIISLVPEGDRTSSFDFAASRAIATSPDLSQYRILHFATHGFANSEHPDLSGIVLSLVDEKGSLQNGYLRLHDIFNLNLTAELVVLSACQTGLGKQIKGEGLIGLTRGFMYAGAPRVVVSLWSVNDQATSELMVKFYQGMLKDGLAPAAALRAAQIQMWQQEKWKSPYYWAAFGLQGEWK